jgi:hypothetical protein
MKKTRITLDLSPEMYSILQKLAKESGWTLADTLRRSIGLFKAAQEARARGDSLCVVKGKQIKVELIWF